LGISPNLLDALDESLFIQSFLPAYLLQLMVFKGNSFFRFALFRAKETPILSSSVTLIFGLNVDTF
jgi:hypothetical protein